MPITIALPNENSAVLKTGEELTNRAVKELRRAARKVGLVGQKLQDLGLDELREEQKATEDSEDPAASAAINKKALEVFSNLSDEDDQNLDLFQRVCTVVRLESWTLDRPLPTTADEVDDLPRPIYAILTTEAAKLDLNEDFSIDGATDPLAPTEDLSASEVHLEAVPS